LTAFIGIQNVLGTVLESFILLDRLLYLEEHEGVEATIVPLFDPEISPRNMAIVATKGLPRSKLVELIEATFLSGSI
jgi:hypothetical protein